MKKFYVYCFARKGGYAPYYVGKGHGDRCYRDRGRNTRAPKDKTRIRIIKDNLTEQEAWDLETTLITFWGRSCNEDTGLLRNVKGGGEGGSFVMSEEQKQKLSEAKRGKHYPKLSEAKKRAAREGRWVSPTQGKRHSEETKQKIREKATGRPSALRGVPKSEEQKAKQSAAMMGRVSWNKGKPMSQEAKDKLSKAKKGRRLSEEHKAKLRGKNLGHTHNNKSCVVRGRQFSSHKEAIQYYGVSEWRVLVRRGWVET